MLREEVPFRMPTIVHGDYEWDSAKSASNKKKHGVSFAEAETAFDDPSRLIISSDSSSGEERLDLIGRSVRLRLLLVIHVERGERFRIISARVAKKYEEALYEDRK
jgi:hypothetical protein